MSNGDAATRSPLLVIMDRARARPAARRFAGAGRYSRPAAFNAR
jgi:hypothetical protein